MILTVVATTFLITACAADGGWRPKRNQPGCSGTGNCWRMFRKIDSVLRAPNFKILVSTDGHLDLECSPSILRRADTCVSSQDHDTQLDVCSHFSPRELLRAWRHLCLHGDEVENLQSCWQSNLLIPALLACSEAVSDRLPMAACAERNISRVKGCGPQAGRLIRQLVDTLNLEQ